MVKTTVVASLGALWLVTSGAWGQSSPSSRFDQQPETRLACERLKAQIDQTIRDNGARHFLLEVVDNAQVEGETVREGEAYAGAEVVGSCDGGTRKVVYSRHGATEMSSPGTASSPEAAEAEERPAESAEDSDEGATPTAGTETQRSSSTSAAEAPSDSRARDSLEPEASP
ncbi:DUF1161 domain-containing protein [Salinicola halophilus]|uniref:DUF1161 domain-containing protein n=1 Tax=Salinicola halophilus TaxID=184065 RepID=UPI0013A5F6D6|nr:DUF1161 domain-containing protein [Salinicola halophilus]